MHQELFDRTTGLVFDAVAPAATAADMSLSLLLNGERAARLVQQKSLDPSLPGLDDVLARTTRAVMNAAAADAYEAEIARAVQRVYVDRLMELAQRASMPQVRALAVYELDRIGSAIPTGSGAEDEAHGMMLAMDIERFMTRPMEPVPARPTMAPGAPPGQPIGMPDLNWLEYCDW
jgi:hypothetical protein